MSGTVTLDGLTTTPQTVNENEWYSLADFLSYQPYESSPGLAPPGTTLLYAGGTFIDPSENLANNYWAAGIANFIYSNSAYQEITYANGTILRYIYVDDPSFPEPSPGLGISVTSLDSIKIEFIAPGTTSIGAILGNTLRWYNTLQVPSYAPGIVPPEEVSAGYVTTNLYAPITVLANLTATPTTTTVTTSLIQNKFGIIYSPNSTGTVNFTDTDSTALPSAPTPTPEISAIGPDGRSVSLTASQQAAIAADFSISATAGNTNNGSINWTYDPTGTALSFIALGETVQVTEPIVISDQFGSTQTSTVSLTLTGPHPTPQTDDASTYGTIIINSTRASFTAMGGLAYQFGVSESPVAADKILGGYFEKLGLAFDFVSIEANFAVELQNAGGNQLAQWQANKNASVDLANAATKALVVREVTPLFTTLGLQTATWAFNALGAATLEAAAESAAFEAISAVFVASSVTVGAPVIAAAVVALGAGLTVNYVYDQYFAWTVKAGYAATYVNLNHPPAIINSESTGYTGDGYLSGATVFQDTNNNGVLDAGEASSVADARGAFDLVNGSGPLVVQGGTDVSTGLAFTGTLRAPEGATMVTPLTTLISVLGDLGVTNVPTAGSIVLTALGLSPYANLLVADPIAGATSGDATSAAIYAAGVEVLDTVEMVGSALQGLGVAGSQASGATFTQIATLMMNGGGQVVDLTSVSIVTNLLNYVLSEENVNFSQETVTGIAGIIAAINENTHQTLAGGLTGGSLVAAISSIGRLAQGAVTAALQTAVANPNTLQSTVDSFTGSNLSAAISTASTQLPLTALNDTESVNAGGTVAVSDPTQGILANDVTGDVTGGGPLSVTSVLGPDGYGVIGQSLTGLFGHLVLNSDGTFTYSADQSGALLAGQVGEDNFNYTITNGTGASASATLAFEVAQTACYREGTRIRTARGDVRVEHLLEGEPAFAASGSFQDIRWIGHRHVDCHRHPRPHEVWPVRIHANAFGHGLPHRDLFLSPDHAVYIDGVLIPIRYLVNGRTIAQEPLDTVTYWHVELDRHDVILAEGLPCESYLDTGNRGAFANGGAPLALHAEPVEANEQVRREAGSCAPLATQADRVEPIWQRLAARAAELGYPVLRPAAIMDPQLRVLVGVREIKPISTTDDQYLFALPSSPTGMVQIISRAASPSDLRPWLDDRRRLGVSVARIILRNEAGVTEIPVDHPSLVDGWHDVERDGGRLWRWTDGAARLPVPSGPHRLEIRLNGSIEYPVEMAAAAQVLAA